MACASPVLFDLRGKSVRLRIRSRLHGPNKSESLQAGKVKRPREVSCRHRTRSGEDKVPARLLALLIRGLNQSHLMLRIHLRRSEEEVDHPRKSRLNLLVRLQLFCLIQNKANSLEDVLGDLGKTRGRQRLNRVKIQCPPNGNAHMVAIPRALDYLLPNR